MPSEPASTFLIKPGIASIDFCERVRRGNFGGLASYRPDGPASTSMTAEALYCRLLLDEMSGLSLTEAAANEATNQVLAALPTAERVNLYYWYYATLALHHRQQENEAPPRPGTLGTTP